MSNTISHVQLERKIFCRGEGKSCWSWSSLHSHQNPYFYLIKRIYIWKWSNKDKMDGAFGKCGEDKRWKQKYETKTQL